MRLILSLLVACAAASCAGTPPPEATDNFSATSFKAPGPGELVVLLPVPPSTPEIAKGEAILLQQLHQQLTAARYRVVIFDADRYAAVWDEEVSAAGGIYDPNTGQLRTEAHNRASSAAAKRVCAETKCALVLGPRLCGRPVRLKQSTAEWDGQRRRVVVVGSARSDGIVTGKALALSVELLGLTGNGTVVFRSFGGASLPFQLDWASSRNVLRPDLFSSDAEIADGVRIALRPLLGS